MYDAKFNNVSVVQPDVFLDRVEGNKVNGLVSAIVLKTHYVDEITNISAMRNIADISINKDIVKQFEDIQNNESLYTSVTGYRIECDVLVYQIELNQTVGVIVKNVPVLQRGGFHNYEMWVPQGVTNWSSSEYGLDFDVSLSYLDGDHVLLGFIGGEFPYGGVIMGCIGHPSNKEDNPYDLDGSFGLPKEFGDRIRKDGNVFISRYNGTYQKIDRTGNYTIDTVQANRNRTIDVFNGDIDEWQDIDSHTKTGDTAPLEGDPTGDLLPGESDSSINYRRDKEEDNPGGGNFCVNLKNNRKIKFAFFDNETLLDDRENPPLFKETGFVQITNDGDSRKIEICMSDSVKIKLRAFGGGEAKFELDTDTSIGAILLGKENMEQLATKTHVEQYFCNHTHTVATMTTSPPIVLNQSMAGRRVADDGFFEDDVVKLNKVATSKTKAE